MGPDEDRREGGARFNEKPSALQRPLTLIW